MNLAPEDVIREVTRLRQVQAGLDPASQGLLEPTIALLITTLGPTVKRSVAARALGVSQPGLDKWIRRGEIATLRTPTGREEVPVNELLGILDEFHDGEGREARPLSAALRRRRERAISETPLDLLPWDPGATSDGHRRADLRSLAYHRAVAKQLTPTAVEAARSRVDRWRAEGRIHPKWADEWSRVLGQQIPQIVKAIGEDTTSSADLRQTSPFAGTLSDYARRHLLRAVEATVS